MLVAGKWATLIPMATLAGILVVVAYNMSEWKNFIAILKSPRSDIAVLLTTFMLTILIDLTVAIEIGMLLAAFLFLRKMIRHSEVNILTVPEEENSDSEDTEGYTIPKGVEVFEITGPLFFGATYKFREAIKLIEKRPAVLIIRMRHVPLIDATGLKALEDVQKEFSQHGGKLILSEVIREQVLKELEDTRLLFAIGKANVTDSFEEALKRCREILSDKQIQSLMQRQMRFGRG